MNNIKSLSRTALIAFLIVYIVWGSTYLAIRYALETLPAFGFTSVRYFIAAAIMALIAVVKKEALLTPLERKVSFRSGFILVTANAMVCVAEYWVASGIVAVIVGAMPIWTMIVGWSAFNQGRPQPIKMLGALIGLAGVGLIAQGSIPSEISGWGRFGVLIVIGSGIFWTVGTFYQRQLPPVKSLFRYSALQMFGGALITGVISLIFEKPWTIDPLAVSLNSVLAVLYLVIFGTVIAFTAYSWLSRNVEPHLVSTYALVNPVIAVFLGWLFFREPVTPTFAAATLLVLVGIALLMINFRLRLRAESPR